MRARHAVIATAFTASVLGACSGGGDPEVHPTRSPTGSPRPLASSRAYTSEALPSLVLKPAEGPAGTHARAEDRGSVSLDEFWSCCKTQREEFAKLGFQAAYRSGFEAPQLPEKPTDWKPGVAFARSVVALFNDAEGASRAMPVWQSFFTASARGTPEKLTIDLGDESSAVTGIFYRDGQRLFIYFWRIGNLILHVRIGGREGSIDRAAIDPLARKMDSRAESA